MKVLKFGGTSVGNADRIKQAVSVIRQTLKKGEKIIVVISAMRGITSLLLSIADLSKDNDDQYKKGLKSIRTSCTNIIQTLFDSTKQSDITKEITNYINELEDILQGVALVNDLSAKTKDKILSYGEIISSKLISSYCNLEGLKNEWLNSQNLLKTDDTFGNANIFKEKSYKNIQQHINQKKDTTLFIAPGFIATNMEGSPTTIGRGGSDYSAAIYAVALNASALEIWTDVSGMMTANPRFVKHTRYIKKLDYATALELCHFGAKIIYPPTLEPAMEKNIPIIVKNTFAPEDVGTYISNDTADNDEQYAGLSSIQEIALISLRGSGIIKLTHIIQRVFNILSLSNIPVLITTQGSSEHFISIGISYQHLSVAQQALETEFKEDIQYKKIAAPNIETDLSMLALVGNNMRDHPGIAARMFTALGRNGINIRAIAQGSSERNISVAIDSKDLKKANLILHEEFFEVQYKVIHVFIVGVGNVGNKLLHQIHKQKELLKNHIGLQIKVIGLANSKKMYFSESGIDLSDWKTQLIASKLTMNINDYIQKMSELNLRNSVFVDVTASNQIALQYENILKKSTSIVACNKIACSIDYDYYKKIKTLSKVYNASLMFETNVGAALPIIDTLNGLIKSGDEIESIEAVLSGTLNFVFNTYDGKRSFSSIVKQAKEAGYTEPDPRIDLSGIDVLRKIVILIREAGIPFNVNDVKVNDFLPKAVMDATIENLYDKLEEYEDTFKKLYTDAKNNNCILKYVASYKNGKASIGLHHISPENDMYHLYNKDNIVVFYTKRYADQPLVIKGAGAGAEVTASGIFADILKTRY